jgi:hypothetical protein
MYNEQIGHMLKDPIGGQADNPEAEWVLVNGATEDTEERADKRQASLDRALDDSEGCSESAANPKKAFGDRKPQLQLVPLSVMTAIAKALAEGAGKYGGYNWRAQPVDQMVYIGSALRHLLAHAEGEDIDPDCDNGKTHLDGAIGSLAILIDSISCETSIDDRPKVRNVNALKALESGNAKQKG